MTARHLPKSGTFHLGAVRCRLIALQARDFNQREHYRVAAERLEIASEISLSQELSELRLMDKDYQEFLTLCRDYETKNH